MKVARDDFAAADKDWALRYTNVARELDFQIDTPFGIEAGDDLKTVWTLSCGEFALRGSREMVPVRSARVVMEVINHCHGKMKDELEGLIDNRPRATMPEGKAVIDLSYRRLDTSTGPMTRCAASSSSAPWPFAARRGPRATGAPSSASGRRSTGCRTGEILRDP